MRNVTISLQEEVARWVRVWAAEHDTSVSRFIGELLKSRMARERQYDLAMRRFLARTPQMLKGEGEYPDREELHERALLR